jgi:PAS domain S-box-containing protein
VRRPEFFDAAMTTVDALNDQPDANDAGEAAAPEDSALRESVRRLKQVTEGSVDYLLLVDRALRVLFANRETAGLQPEQTIGRSVETLFPPRSAERARACMQRVLQLGIADRFEVEWPGTNGVTRFVEVRVAPVRENGQVVALTLNGSDTTAHVLAQRAIATQAKMIESMLEGVALLNELGVVVITNPAFDRLFGYARGMLIGQPVATLAGGASLDQGMLSALTGNAGPWPLEFDAKRKDGSPISVSGALSRLQDAGRTHLLLVLQDISERKQLEGAILEAVNREQYRIGNDLHDGLGQELTGIALMLRCLAGRLAVEHRNAVPDVESITRLVSNAVESTRSLARGLSPVNLERGGLRDALEGLAMHARSVYGIKAAFTNRLPPEIILEAETANHLYRIAQEAMTNAVKHGRASAVRLQLSVSHRKLRLLIADDGCGFGPEAEQSLGMGLRIMRYRARIARGDVRIERGEPSGTRVICECRLPADQHADSKSSAAMHAASSAAAHSAMRVRPRRVAAKHGAPSVGRVAIKRAGKPSAQPSHKQRRTRGEHK